MASPIRMQTGIRQKTRLSGQSFGSMPTPSGAAVDSTQFLDTVVSPVTSPPDVGGRAYPQLRRPHRRVQIRIRQEAVNAVRQRRQVRARALEPAAHITLPAACQVPRFMQNLGVCTTLYVRT